jgi:hypothetical protein
MTPLVARRDPTRPGTHGRVGHYAMIEAPRRFADAVTSALVSS